MAEFIVTNIYRLNAQRLAEYYFGELNTQQSYVYQSRRRGSEPSTVA